MRCDTGSDVDVAGCGKLGTLRDRVRLATGWGPVNKILGTGNTVGGILGTLGAGACTVGVGGCTLGARGSTLGDGCCSAAARRSSHFSFGVGGGWDGGSRLLRVRLPDHLPSAPWRDWMATSWSVDVEDGFP